MKWASSKKYRTQLISEHKGDEAGIKSSTIKIEGEYIYGWLKSESGIHRLVRISPFDSGARRHTSFASVWVYPVVDENIDIEISNIDPVKNFSRLNLLSNDGAANGKISTHWQNAKLITANGDLEYSDFSLTTNEHSIPIKNINLSFAAARKLDKDWSLKVDLHHLQSVNGAWSPSEYQFEFIKDDTSNKYKCKGFLSFLKLEDIFPLIVETEIVPCLLYTSPSPRD